MTRPPHGIMRPGYAGTTTNLQLVLNTQKTSTIKQATQQNTCQIFLPKKTFGIKISNPKKSFDHPRLLKSGVPPPLDAKPIQQMQTKQ